MSCSTTAVVETSLYSCISKQPAILHALVDCRAGGMRLQAGGLIASSTTKKLPPHSVHGCASARADRALPRQSFRRLSRLRCARIYWPQPARSLTSTSWMLLLIPVHWLLLSLAAWRAAWQLMFAPAVVGEDRVWSRPPFAAQRAHPGGAEDAGARALTTASRGRAAIIACSAVRRPPPELAPSLRSQ